MELEKQNKANKETRFITEHYRIADRHSLMKRMRWEHKSLGTPQSLVSSWCPHCVCAAATFSKLIYDGDVVGYHGGKYARERKTKTKQNQKLNWNGLFGRTKQNLLKFLFALVFIHCVDATKINTIKCDVLVCCLFFCYCPQKIYINKTAQKLISFHSFHCLINDGPRLLK